LGENIPNYAFKISIRNLSTGYTQTEILNNINDIIMTLDEQLLVLGNNFEVRIYDMSASASIDREKVQIKGSLKQEFKLYREETVMESITFERLENNEFKLTLTLNDLYKKDVEDLVISDFNISEIVKDENQLIVHASYIGDEIGENTFSVSSIQYSFNYEGSNDFPISNNFTKNNSFQVNIQKADTIGTITEITAYQFYITSDFQVATHTAIDIYVDVLSGKENVAIDFDILSDQEAFDNVTVLTEKNYIYVGSTNRYEVGSNIIIRINSVSWTVGENAYTQVINNTFTLTIQE
jgi:hypothetical protein